jgi:hypothetical protein
MAGRDCPSRGDRDWTRRRGLDLHPRPDRWSLHDQRQVQPTAAIVLDADTTWRLCTRSITPETAAERARVDGDRRLAAAALQIVSIIWSPPDHNRSFLGGAGERRGK